MLLTKACFFCNMPLYDSYGEKRWWIDRFSGSPSHALHEEYGAKSILLVIKRLLTFLSTRSLLDTGFALARRLCLTLTSWSHELKNKKREEKYLFWQQKVIVHAKVFFYDVGSK